MADTEVTFVVALPGWDVLYYFKGGRFETTPIIAWAVFVDGGMTRAIPVTSDVEWALDDSRPICTPDGDVTLGDLEHWSSVWTWLDDMKKREQNDPRALPPSPNVKIGDPHSAPVLALDAFRDKFER